MKFFARNVISSITILTFLCTIAAAATTNVRGRHKGSSSAARKLGSKSNKDNDNDNVFDHSTCVAFDEETQSFHHSSKKSKKSKGSSKTTLTLENCACPCCDFATCEATYTAVLDNGEDLLEEYGICPLIFPVLNMIDDLYSINHCTYDQLYDPIVIPDGYMYCCEMSLGCYGPPDEFDEENCCQRKKQRRRRDRQLNENSRLYGTRKVEEITNDGSIHTVEVENTQTDNIDWILQHVEEMKQRIDTGDVTREWDELFQAIFEHAPKEIQIECENQAENNKIHCIYTSLTECGIDLTKALLSYHTEIATKIQETGHHGIWDNHEIPESCLP